MKIKATLITMCGCSKTIRIEEATRELKVPLERYNYAVDECEDPSRPRFFTRSFRIHSFKKGFHGYPDEAVYVEEDR